MPEINTSPVPSPLPEPPTLRYRPARFIVRLLVSLLGAGAFIDAAIMALVPITDHRYPHLLRSSVAPQGNEEIAIIFVLAGLVLLRLLAFILSAVMFCVWAFRANKNVRALGVSHMRFTPGWCVIWFFVPIMSLFKPYQAIKEIYIHSNPELSEPPRYESESVQLVGWWWTAWIAALMFASFSDPNAQNISIWGSTPAQVTGILAALLAIGVVITVHRRQERKAYLNPQLNQAFCMECNYDLRASAGETCPECGQAIPGRGATG